MVNYDEVERNQRELKNSIKVTRRKSFIFCYKLFGGFHVQNKFRDFEILINC